MSGEEDNIRFDVRRGKECGVLNQHEKDSELTWPNSTEEWKERRTHNSRDQNEVF
jgi:hypothetical protein